MDTLQNHAIFYLIEFDPSNLDYDVNKFKMVLYKCDATNKIILCKFFNSGYSNALKSNNYFLSDLSKINENPSFQKLSN